MTYYTFGASGPIHCGNCGRVDPDTSDGYTACCNETLCEGQPREWCVLGRPVSACCPTRAPAGVEVQHLYSARQCSPANCPVLEY